eukprot:GHVQ01002369.1.p2 GENE.GHVQ01002369.1~~GHVQ01002369.1.p2  ORF type:complete len:107 (-),score=15.42 GHVQ01002369.1:705-1025(-)
MLLHSDGMLPALYDVCLCGSTGVCVCRLTARYFIHATDRMTAETGGGVEWMHENGRPVCVCVCVCVCQRTNHTRTGKKYTPHIQWVYLTSQFSTYIYAHNYIYVYI